MDENQTGFSWVCWVKVKHEPLSKAVLVAGNGVLITFGTSTAALRRELPSHRGLQTHGFSSVPI